MLRSSLSLLLLLVASFLRAHPVIDSLWTVYHDRSRPAKERISCLHELWWEHQSSNGDSARTLAERLVREATAAGERDLIALGHRDRGDIFSEVDFDNERAMAAYRTAIAVWSTINDKQARKGIAVTYGSMGRLLKKAGNLDSAMMLYRRSMDMNRAIGNDGGIVYTLSYIARVYEVQGQLDSAFNYYERSRVLADTVNDDNMEAAGFGNCANVLERQGRIGEAIDLAYKCMAIMERIGNDRGVAVTLTQLASLAEGQGQRTEALALIRKAHALYSKVGYKQGVMTSSRRLGALLLDLGRTDSAITVLEASTSAARELDAREILCPALNRLGEAYTRVGRYTEAQRVLEESLVVGRDLDDAPSMSGALAHLGEVAIAQGAHARAVRHCSEGLAMAERVSALSERGLNCGCLYKAHKALGHGMDALTWLESYHDVQDSLVKDANTRALTQRDMVYSFSKEQLKDSLEHASVLADVEHAREVEQLRADRNRRTALLSAIAGALVLAGITAFFISDRRRRQARFEKEAAQLETQALRSQMNPHFIFNALNSINAFVQKNEPDRAAAFLSRFARLMRLVLENSRQGEVPLKDDLEALDNYLHLERARSGEKFDYTIRVEPGLDVEEVFVPPLVAQPFVENAIWHGMNGKEGKGHITLGIARKQDELVFTIDDDGVGRHAPKKPVEGVAIQKKSSLGTAITQARLDLVSKQKGRPAGYRYVDLPVGTRVELTLPVSDGA